MTTRSERSVSTRRRLKRLGDVLSGREGGGSFFVAALGLVGVGLVLDGLVEGLTAVAAALDDAPWVPTAMLLGVGAVAMVVAYVLLGSVLRQSDAVMRYRAVLRIAPPIQVFSGQRDGRLERDGDDLVLTLDGGTFRWMVGEPPPDEAVTSTNLRPLRTLVEAIDDSGARGCTVHFIVAHVPHGSDVSQERTRLFVDAARGLLGAAGIATEVVDTALPSPDIASHGDVTDVVRSALLTVLSGDVRRTDVAVDLTAGRNTQVAALVQEAATVNVRAGVVERPRSEAPRFVLLDHDD